MKQINPSRLRNRLKFGHIESSQGVNGINIEEFVCDREVWGGLYKNTMTQQYILMGQGNTDSQTFIIRHDERLLDCTHMVYNDKTYKNLVFNQDTDQEIDGFDTVTGERVNKNGG